MAAENTLAQTFCGWLDNEVNNDRFDDDETGDGYNAVSTEHDSVIIFDNETGKPVLRVTAEEL